jgi:hypothetical protein
MRELHAVVEQWAQNFNEGNAEAIRATLFAGSTIWGTLAQRLITSDEKIKGCFAGAARAGLRVKLREACLLAAFRNLHYRYGALRILADRARRGIPARHTFLLVKQNSAWLIAHQHSSMLPKPAG